ncbi:MAG: hypothetical protein QOE61_2291, partial [Micromonosporaceae bacterium]|nr:hypothetical protein [Micromonosporaceae bacterium]
MQERGHRGSRAFADYFGARRDAVRRTAYLLCGDWHWADDLTQMAFVRLAASWGRVREPAALDAFVRTCLIRAHLAETRRVWRRRERTYADLPEQSSSGDATENVDGRLAFVAALKQVPPRQRATLVCRYQDAGQCSALQGGGEGLRGRAVRPERALDRAVLLLDVLAEDTERCAAHRACEVRPRPKSVGSVVVGYEVG